MVHCCNIYTPEISGSMRPMIPAIPAYTCYECDDGSFWMGNGTSSVRVNYCPLCGERAPNFRGGKLNEDRG